MKKARAGPVSEHLLGKSRPKLMFEDCEVSFVWVFGFRDLANGIILMGMLSILNAATNDLEQYAQCYASAVWSFEVVVQYIV